MKMQTTGIFLGALCGIAVGVGAATVSEADVRTAAKGWRSQTDAFGMSLGRGVASVAALTTTNAATFYAVKLANGGTLFMNSDDELEPVLGFTDADEDFSTLDPQSPLGALLNQTVSCTHAALAQRSKLQAAAVSGPAATGKPAKWRALIAVGQPSLAESAVTSVSGISDLRVPALLQTRWGQTTAYTGAYCYNYYTPNHYYCGCVATAMGQVMRYFRYPVAAVAPFTETCWVDGVARSLTAQGGIYDWDAMPLSPSYSPAPSETCRQAIGKLISDAGIAVNMMYKGGGSSAYGDEAGEAMKVHFGYANAVAAGVKSAIAAGGETRLNVLRRTMFANFDAGLPVLVAIPGHEVVMDGYGFVGDTDYVHVNLGYSGRWEYWYNLPDLTASGFSSFTAVSDVVYNIYPTGAVARAVCSGRVLDRDGTPCAGATVVVSNEMTVCTTTTSAYGVWGVIVGNGFYSVRAVTVSGELKGGLDGVYVAAPTTQYKRNASNSHRASDWVVNGAYGNSWGNDIVALPTTAVEPTAVFGVTVTATVKDVATTVPVSVQGLDLNTTAKLSTLIDVSTLAAGDKVRVWNGSAYTIFVRTDANDGWRSEQAEGQAETQTDIDVPVGTGIVLQTGADKSVVARGRVPSVLTTVVAADRTTRLANPRTTPFNLGTITPATVNDTLVVDGKTFDWDATKNAWCTRASDGTVDETAALTIPAGQSFWYVGKGAAGTSVTITW